MSFSVGAYDRHCVETNGLKRVFLSDLDSVMSDRFIGTIPLDLQDSQPSVTWCHMQLMVFALISSTVEALTWPLVGLPDVAADAVR